MYEAAKKPAWTWDFLSTPAYKYGNKDLYMSMRLSKSITKSKQILRYKKLNRV